jgi:hypothetical protein
MTIIITFVTALGTNAQSWSHYQAIRSKAVDDLILEIWLYKTDQLLYNTNSIGYDWLTVTNKSLVVNLPKDEYFCYAEMFDSESNAVPLRSDFRNLGKRFYDLKYPSVEQPWSALKDVLRMKPARITGPSGPVLGIGSQMESDFVRAEQDIGEQRSGVRRIS